VIHAGSYTAGHDLTD